MQTGGIMNTNLVDKIYWETNSRVKNSNLINSSKIIQKTSTADFPADAITIRLHNTSSQDLTGTAYFYGKNKTYTDWSGQPYQVAEGRLMVTIYPKTDKLVFNGELHTKSYSTQDITDIINYCKDTISKL